MFKRGNAVSKVALRVEAHLQGYQVAEWDETALWEKVARPKLYAGRGGFFEGTSNT
jgi:hypothetical protein